MIVFKKHKNVFFCKKKSRSKNSSVIDETNPDLLIFFEFLLILNTTQQLASSIYNFCVCSFFLLFLFYLFIYLILISHQLRCFMAKEDCVCIIFYLTRSLDRNYNNASVFQLCYLLKCHLDFVWK